MDEVAWYPPWPTRQSPSDVVPATASAFLWTMVGGLVAVSAGLQEMNVSAYANPP